MKTGLDEQSYRSLFLSDEFPSAVIDFSTDEIHEVNQAFEELTGLTSAEICGRRFNEVIEQTMAWTRDDSQGDMEMESSQSGPWRLVRLRRLGLSELERRAGKMESMAILAAGIGHDFNNALMAALPWADLLRRKHPADAGIQTATEHIRSAIFRARDVTSLLLDFAKPAPPRKARYDLVSLVRERSTHASAFSSDITVRYQLPDETIPVDLDRAQFVRAFEHLRRNAVEAIYGTGTIEIRVSRAPHSLHEEKRLAKDREFALLEIIDDGRGMSRETLEHAFDPFFTTKEVRSGAGLGLSIVFRIIEEHGGAVRVTSQPGQGTRVEVFLPTPLPEIQAAVTETAPLHILLVDDETAIVEGIKASLELSSVEVTAAGSGEEALGLLRAGLRPDVIVLDLGLPEMRGSEVHALIRQIDPMIPIIISSGWTSGTEATGLLADGRTRLLQKPYDPEEIIEELKKF